MSNTPEYNKKYRLLNKRKINILIRNWKRRNRKLLNERQKIYRNNKIVAIRTRLGNLLRIHMKDYYDGKKYKCSKYGINFKEIIEHLKPFPEDISKYHIDHIKPLCLFDLTNPDEVKKAFAPANLQWLTIQDNLKKGNKYV